MRALSKVAEGTLVLDSEGLSIAVARDRRATTRLQAAERRNLAVIVSAVTLVDVIQPRINRSALRWLLSRLLVVPVTEALARDAADLLGEAGLHGHRHAIDAMVAATALAAVPPVTVLTSDPDDISALCGDRVAVVAL